MYASIEYANAFFEKQLFADKWKDLPEDQKAAALTMATRNIDNMKSLRLGFKGHKADELQENEFPRDLYGEDIPKSIKDACCLEALEQIERGNDPRTKAIKAGVTSFSVGKFSESYNKTVGQVAINPFMLSLEGYNMVFPYIQTGGTFPID